jgi:hypothetical protein
MQGSPQGPPQIRRRLRFSPLQAIGILALLSIPALALAGVFGTDVSSASAESEGLRVDVTYPGRMRYK